MATASWKHEHWNRVVRKGFLPAFVTAARSLLVGIPLKAECPAKVVNPPAALPAQGNVKTVGQSVRLNKSSHGDSAITP